jgi:exoribonuclease R
MFRIILKKEQSDDEAYQEQLCVYLVDRVVPMLPEVLSNFACSLRPKKKYTFSAIFEITETSQVNGLEELIYSISVLLTRKRSIS